MAKLEITQVRSSIGHKPKQKLTLEALGLKKLNSTVIKEDNVQTRGMIKKVEHLVSVKEV